MSTVVRDNPAANRYEVYEDEQLAGFTAYELVGTRIAFVHTEIIPAFEGRGLASRLVAAELADARRRRLAVLPFCPFVLRAIAKDPGAYLDLVPPQERAGFDLPPSAD